MILSKLYLMRNSSSKANRNIRNLNIAYSYPLILEVSIYLYT